jgi:enoyl-CoA hydratase/carnithine racemase
MSDAAGASESPVLVEVRGHVAVITLNRPDRLNAITSQMGAAYARALREADANPEIRVAVVTGSGLGFCSGADLSVLAQGPDGEEIDLSTIDMNAVALG